jgi:O-antigen/teichoic acid export membrane protein
MKNNLSFLANALIYGLGSTAGQLASFILLPLYTHYLTPADYGVLDILQRTGEIIVLLLLGNGIQTATFSFYCQAKSHEERQQTFSSIAIVLWGLLGVGAIAAFIIAPYLAPWLEIDNPNLVLLGIAVVLLGGGAALPMALMQARVEALAYVTVNLLMAVTRMTLIIVAVAVLGMGIWGVLWSSAVCSGIAVLILTLREVTRGVERPEPKLAADIVRFALPLLPAGLFGLILVSADRFFLLRYATPADVGTYSLGYKLAAAIPMLAIMPLWKVWSAKLYDYFKEPNAPRVVGRVISRILAARVFVGLGICLFSVEIVNLVAPVEYRAASQVITLLTVASILQLASNLFDSSLWVSRQTKWKPIIRASSAAVALVSYFIFVPSYGSMGAAIAVTAGYATQTWITFIVAQKISFVSYDWRAIYLGLTIAGAVFLAGQLIGIGIAATITKCIMWLSWPVLLWYLNVVNSEEKTWARRQCTRTLRFLSKFSPVP